MKFHEIQSLISRLGYPVVKGVDAERVRHALNALSAVQWMMGALIMAILCILIRVVVVLDDLHDSAALLFLFGQIAMVLVLLAGCFAARVWLSHLQFTYSQREYEVEVVDQ